MIDNQIIYTFYAIIILTLVHCKSHHLFSNNDLNKFYLDKNTETEIFFPKTFDENKEKLYENFNNNNFEKKIEFPFYFKNLQQNNKNFNKYEPKIIYKNIPSSYKNNLLERFIRSKSLDQEKPQRYFFSEPSLYGLIKSNLFYSLTNDNLKDNIDKKIENMETKIYKDNQFKYSNDNKNDDIKEDKNQLITNNSNYLPVIEIKKNPTEIETIKQKIIPKTYHLSRSRINNNKKHFADCIKKCMSQKYLHPVQCQSLC